MGYGGNMNSVDSGLIRFYENGEASIVMAEDGRPCGIAVLPAPSSTELEIEQMVEQAKRSYWIRGYYIQSISRVRNPVFDKANERTTTKIEFRACRNATEATFVLEKAKQLLKVFGKPSA